MRLHILAACLAFLSVSAQAQQAATPMTSSSRPPIPYPVETVSPAASAKEALLRCAKGAVVQTWHVSCVIRSAWGSRRDPHDPPPPHSTAFLQSALTEAATQTKRYRTRENAAYTLVAKQLTGRSGTVSYTEFLDMLGQAFRTLPASSATNFASR